MDFDTEVSEGENINIENEEELTTTNEELETQVTESIPQYKTYTVSKYGSGEGFSTLWAISQDSGVSIEDIKAANPEIGEDNVIHPEQIIIVPIINEEVATEEIPEEKTKVKEVEETVANVSSEEVLKEIEESSEKETIVEETTQAVDTIDEIKETTINNTAVYEVEIPNEIKSVANICKSFTAYNLENWSYTQEKIYNEWVGKGSESDKGIATIDGLYLVAVSKKYGNVGDKITVVLEDGTEIPCLIADQKADKDLCNSFGSPLTTGATTVGKNIIEWEACNGNTKEEIKRNIEIESWNSKNVSIDKIINNGSWFNENT